MRQQLVSSLFLFSVSLFPGILNAQELFSRVYLDASSASSLDTAGSLVFEVKPRSRCMFGDLDALSLDIKRSDGSAALQLSVEPLLQSEGGVIYGEAVGQSLPKPSLGAYSVTFPKNDTPQIYGVYLCSVEQGSKRRQPCSRQHVMGINKMLYPYRVDKEKAFNKQGQAQAAPLTDYNRATSTYKNYYFNFIIVERSEVRFLGDTLNAAQKSQLAGILEGQGIASNQELIDDIARFSDVLGSLALRENSNRLQMLLPYYDRKRCLGE